MLTRIITSIVALCVLFPVLFLSDTWIFPIAVSICCFISCYEIFKCIGILHKWIISIPLIIFSVVATVSIRIIGDIKNIGLLLVVLLLVEILYIMVTIVFSKGKIVIEQITVAALLSFYIMFGFSSIIILHDSFTLGHYTYLLIFLGAWITDIFAYFCGVIFGKHKLIPEVSPNKTIEGSVGGTVFCGLAFVLFGVVMKLLTVDIGIGYIWLFIFGIIAAVVAQIGDLSMSAIKRHYSIKDFGKIFPGHGGMLDRFDSILAVSIVLLIINIITIK